MKTNNSILVTAPEIAKDLGISTTSAYKLIHKWNAELEAKTTRPSPGRSAADTTMNGSTA